MKINIINNQLEYTSLFLVLTYFIVHKIALVLIGIILSHYILNKAFIDNIIRLFKKKQKVKEEIEIENPIEIESKNIILNKEGNNVKLVDTIEELGFIPSIDKEEDSKVA